MAALIHFFFFRMGSHSPFHMVKSFLGEKVTLLASKRMGIYST
jgi:hypothetical protein